MLSISDFDHLPLTGNMRAILSTVIENANTSTGEPTVTVDGLRKAVEASTHGVMDTLDSLLWLYARGIFDHEDRIHVVADLYEG